MMVSLMLTVMKTGTLLNSAVHTDIRDADGRCPDSFVKTEHHSAVGAGGQLHESIQELFSGVQCRFEQLTGA